jgi:hypothetical protein
MSNRSFGSRIAGMVKAGENQVFDFWNLVYNAVLRTAETNDASHINKMIPAALAVGRFRTFTKVVPGLIFFAFAKDARIFGGKLQRSKFNELTAKGESDLPVWHERLIAYIALEQDDSAKAAPSDYSLEARVLTLVKGAHKHGKRDSTIYKTLERVIAAEKAAA